MESTELARWRSELPITERCAYFNHAGIGPCPRRSARAAAGCYEQLSATGDAHWPDRNRLCEEVRSKVAAFLGARDHEIAFLQNTADALSVVAMGLPWDSGDNVVGADKEFPANVYPWMHLADLGVEYRRAPERDGRLDLDELLALVDERTRVLALSWVQYGSGFRADLPRLGAFCRERGILFVVDVIQGFGALELDVESSWIDVAAAATHKWVLGPEGLGVLYLSDRVVDRLRPSRAGWRSVARMFDWQNLDLAFNEGAKRHECGTLNYAGIACLGASLDLLTSVGMGEVQERVLAHASGIAEGLARRGFAVLPRRRGEESGIVAARHAHRSPGEIVRRLAEQGVVVAERAGRLRISPHFYNDAADLARLWQALDELA